MLMMHCILLGENVKLVFQVWLRICSESSTFFFQFSGINFNTLVRCKARLYLSNLKTSFRYLFVILILITMSPAIF